METKKQKVFLMFYPIDWQRHVFDNYDHTESEGIAERVKELQREYPNDSHDITFTPWGEYAECIDAYCDADLFNVWDDDAEDWLIKECEEMIRDNSLDLTKGFIMEHWCVPITDYTKNAIQAL